MTLPKKINVENEVQETKDLSFRFYKVMDYPIPQEEDYFAYHTKKKVRACPSSPSFSRSKKSSLMSDFLIFLKRWKFLYSNFPFVEEIFLANSMTFNALSSSSDIDLFVITQQGRIWTARFMMSLILRVFGIKRSKKSEYQRFCLSFFVDRTNINLEKLLLHERDVYLPYWIAHLVPLYQEQRSEAIFEQNAWISRFLPNFPLKQTISLGIEVQNGKGKFKALIEFLFAGKLGDILERLIAHFWKKRIARLQAKNPELHRGVIISDGVLKFHYDKREEYSELFFSYQS